MKDQLLIPILIFSGLIISMCQKNNDSHLKPDALFTADQISITECDTVNFTDQSTNSPTEWFWDFGDGNTSTSQNPSNIYITAGIYTVSLTATNSYGSDAETKTRYITVTENRSGNGEIIFNPDLTYGTVTDIECNTYKTIQIGTQNWMANNLKTTKYNDGTSIPIETSDSKWEDLSTPAYCWYDNNISNKATYGALYNWYTVNTTSNGGKNVCPSGWHVPTIEEWLTLREYLGGFDIGGRKLKETDTTHWISPNSGATNESGFTALPGGLRSFSSGKFIHIGDQGRWWSSSDYIKSNASHLFLSHSNAIFNLPPADWNNGLSIRCVKD
jgi:uncharacterized protein (TIGR02145 family)